MLRYLNSGMRQYPGPRQTLARRSCWEFQAVVAGRCAPLAQLHAAPNFTRRTLWVFPPGHLHGWASEPHRPCRVVVAHFERVPEPIRRAGYLSKSLTISEARKVEQTLLDLRPDYDKPTELSPLRIERALLELSLIALSQTSERRIDAATNKITGAMAWFAEHMSVSPSVGDVANAVHLSESHLRRLFAQSGAGSPRSEMRKIQIDRALHLIETTELLLRDIAEACGFTSLSDFSRVFKQQTGAAPRRVRTARRRGAK
jgi:AraC family transcriptional regulator